MVMVLGGVLSGMPVLYAQGSASRSGEAPAPPSAEVPPESGAPPTETAAPVASPTAAPVPAAAPAPAADTATANGNGGGADKKAMSLIPFWGADKNLNVQFDAVLNQVMARHEQYRPEPVDMNNLPPDVPPGGFPPYVCPSPSMTKDAPYALTGEITSGDDGDHVRMYLWEMANNRLLFSDELVALDKDQFQGTLPSMLEWLFSWIGDPAQAAESGGPAAGSPGAGTRVDDKWLYLGLRAGPAFGFYARAEGTPFTEQAVTNFGNLNAAFQASVQLLSFLSVQTEVVFATDFAPFRWLDKTDPTQISLRGNALSSYSLMIPLLLKYTYRQPRYYGAAFAGLYAAMPLGEMETKSGNFKYSLDTPAGYVLGIGTGMRAGPGFLFLDIRWSADLGQTCDNKGDPLYKRSMVSIGIGYELGLINKKPKMPPGSAD
jgi:hypothetical protein